MKAKTLLTGAAAFSLILFCLTFESIVNAAFAAL